MTPAEERWWTPLALTALYLPVIIGTRIGRWLGRWVG